MRFQGKLNTQTQENVEKAHFVPDFAPLGSNSGRQIFFHKSLSSSVIRYHGRQLSSCTTLTLDIRRCPPNVERPIRWPPCVASPVSYKNLSQIPCKIFASQCFFTDHLKHKTVNKATRRMPSVNPYQLCTN